MKHIVLVFGNKFLKEDSLAVEIADELEIPGVEFRHCDIPDTILEYLSMQTIYIMDVCKKISEVTLINSVKELKEHRTFSLHDFDLGMFLLMLDACGKAGNIKIIGIPMAGDRKVIKNKVTDIIHKEVLHQNV